MAIVKRINSITLLNETYQNKDYIEEVDTAYVPWVNNDMSNAFCNDISLVSIVNINENVTNMSGTFSNCQTLMDISEIPSSVTNLYNTFYNCLILESSLEIPVGVTNMTQSFYNCTRLGDAPVIPNSVTNMYKTFDGCYSLESATDIPESVTDLRWTFSNCTNLKESPEIDAQINDMSGTFYNCQNLVNAPVIPNSVTNMYKTFSDCINLISVPIIHNNIVNMESAFYNCYSLVDAPNMINASNVIDMSQTFYNCNSLMSDKEISYYVWESDDFENKIYFGSEGYELGNELYKVIVTKDPETYYGYINDEDDNYIYYIKNEVPSIGDKIYITYNYKDFEEYDEIDDIQTVIEDEEEIIYIHLLNHNISAHKNEYTNITTSTEYDIDLDYVYEIVNKEETENGYFVTLRHNDELIEDISIENNSYIIYKTIPNIFLPNNVTNMYMTFYNCQSLVNAPVIPNSVVNMSETFSICDGLENITNIPNSVVDMYRTFYGCESLGGNIYIESENISNATNCFDYTSLDKNVYIPFQNDGVNTATYNAFIEAGYKTDVRVNGVLLIDLNGIDVDLSNYDWHYLNDDPTTNDVIIERWNNSSIIDETTPNI